MITITSLYTRPDGKSHFRELQIDMVESDGPVEISKYINTRPIFFIDSQSASPNASPHCAPRRQLVVILEGELQVELDSGEKRLFRPGQILLAEDTTGSGHISRTKNRKALVIPLEPGELTEPAGC
jgi:mannose-6-phosphate isomerase-like protein (cupin superfamily)